MIDLVVDDVLNMVNNGFVFGKDDSVLNDLLNSVKLLNLSTKLNGLLNDNLKGILDVVLDAGDEGVDKGRAGPYLLTYGSRNPKF